MNIKKLLILLATISWIITLWWMYAVQIGTGSVQGDPTFDSPINWDGTFGGTNNASGSVSNILVTATVQPYLNMVISTGIINLGTLSPNTPSTGSLYIEIWTNAVWGVTVTARSQSGWLTNTTDPTIQINNLTTDWLAESYKFLSQTGAAADSSIAGFSATANLNVEVNDNTTDHVIYQTNKWEKLQNVDDILFSVAATIVDETPAGNYEDRITFTVSGNF